MELAALYKKTSKIISKGIAEWVRENGMPTEVCSDSGEAPGFIILESTLKKLEKE